MKDLAWLPPEAEKIFLVLFLSFLIGLEREEHKLSGEQYAFGGVRTYPLIGLIGYALALLSGVEVLPVVLGFLLIGGFLMLSYSHKLVAPGGAGVTLRNVGAGDLPHRRPGVPRAYWIATALAVASVVLLDLKAALESLAKRIEQDDILTFAKFMVLSAVILPYCPTPSTRSSRSIRSRPGWWWSR
ncbi:MAG: MgtC/SapB family protein [Rhodospirillales bacterium]